MSIDFVDAWTSESREFAFACSPEGKIVAVDERARKRFALVEGDELTQRAAPGVEDKLQSFLTRAKSQPVEHAEIPLVSGSRIITCSFRAKPGEKGEILILGSCLPEEHSHAMTLVSQSMEEVLTLNREVVRQKREIQQRNEQLAQTIRELDESNKGITSLHSELLDSADVLRRTSEVKSRVVANVSHEFRTPVHTILGLSRLLMDGTDGPLTEEQQKQIRFIRTSAEELSALVDDVLDLSLAESGKAIMRLEKFGVSDFFAAIRGTLRPLVQKPDAVDLIFEMPPFDIDLETDRGKIAQIIRNLVSNALKFTEQGHVEIRATQQGNEVLFKVTDTGIGIAPENFDRIFEEFGQIDGPLQARVKGSGLGLPIARKLAELLGGSLTVQSEAGRGTEFTLRVPCVHPEVKEMVRIVEQPIDPNRAPILVVEDDRKTIFIYERYLAMAGFQVLPARTIADAEHILKNTKPAAIVLDVMLEGETTWNFLAGLKSNPETHDIPVLVVTVTNRESKARALGADEFWLKPVDKDRLLRKLKTMAKFGSTARILVIDDDERARYLMRKHLDGGPYELIEAASGAEGVQRARESLPNVIMLDFLLRGSTAFDVLDELKADPRTRNIPVVIVTSHNLDPVERERLAAQTEVILSKESLSRELAINRIRDALRKSGLGAKVGMAAVNGD